MHLLLQLLQLICLTCMVKALVAESMKTMSIVRNSINERIYIEIKSSASRIQETNHVLNGDKLPPYECQITVNCRSESNQLVGCAKGSATGLRLTAREGIPYAWMSSIDVVISEKTIYYFLLCFDLYYKCNST